MFQSLRYLKYRDTYRQHQKKTNGAHGRKLVGSNPSEIHEECSPDDPQEGRNIWAKHIPNTNLGARWPKWLEREFTDRKVRGSNPTSASRLSLSRLGQPGSIPALVQPSGGMAVRLRKDATTNRFNENELTQPVSGPGYAQMTLLKFIQLRNKMKRFTTIQSALVTQNHQCLREFV
ncbi:hypothetical protein T265_05405 [Opisthorchis viverrini]|uniref:Uncharacterized protein n=1 Tax=Opisthorchis viverrini TaxID=6198 RepID=A0A075AFC7_OPIVI|nr:hypothetical protein T265_05405 [Opisthorchis viverrini]KER27589.1 hypothetical protein T265_05405 [Opisthorchis viverrini]